MGKVINRIGEEKLNNFGSKMKIVKYNSCSDVDIYFEEYNWTAKNKTYKVFKDGTIKCPYEPRTFGVGYLGEGEYKPTLNNNESLPYKYWRSMMFRCYSDKLHVKEPMYKNCIVCDDWLNFQNFAKWFDENYYEVENECMQLDKDILVKDNKVYSPDNCTFIPQRINALFIQRDSDRGEYPIGVTYNKRDNLFYVFCESKYLGSFDNPKDGFNRYKTYKENLIKQVADEYKDKIPQRLYKAMYSYKVEITD